ncbi:hydantoinase/carbamoylase family amidase [Niallia circulans]|jgi:hydantoinase/carbamoylase family amidase|nr:Zn-dependent hydrolase [Niallia circulans]MED3841213.1 Zn-dependent hydrolase [Niallia circulans]MED4246061.1 Zn-dependent hydrolase [Niallia circulans]MED4247628.1 Zn-dependent hydrolase [Niallia circulans]MED5099922.1 Zn-dependent hydrolase [Niallia circulans]SPT84497.1 hydantoinase/carbamoylase family amidase [Niallia circulans]
MAHNQGDRKMDRKRRYEELLNNMNQYNSGTKGITRVAFTNEEQACSHAFMRLCKNEGLEIRMDYCGNIIARREGKQKNLPPVVIGSHLDTVYQGGKYDGVVGVTAGLEVIKRLNEQNLETEHPIEIISFACEESSRFGVSTVGSKAMAGTLQKEKYRHLKDKDGITFEKALSLCALRFDQLDLASRATERFQAFFELHIEQGPILMNTNKKIGIVTGVAAPVRFIIEVKGAASHSGTTPMNMRKDALLGASELALALEEAAKEEQHNGTVATIGVLSIPMGAMNVVPGTVEMKVDIRSTSTASRNKVLTALLKKMEDVQERRGLTITSQEISKEEPVQLSKELTFQIEKICLEKKLPYQWMQSGAGHDAMNMTSFGPVGLIFIPSLNGISHHPDEHTDLDDILIGIDVLEAAVLQQAIAVY